MLEAKSVQAAYGRRTVLDQVELVIGAGECVALAGPNGSGKSTLLRTLARLHKPAHGAVLLDGKELTRWPARALARRLAVLPQAPRAPEALTVEQLVALGRHPHQTMVGVATAIDRAAVQEALDCTGLTALAGRRLDELSGGERQRAWIALTLAQQPSLLLLDEPTTYLDLAHGLTVLELVRRLNRERGLTVVMALHDLSQMLRFADRVVLLKEGRVAADGPPETTLTAERIAAVFGVEVETARTASGLPLLMPVRAL